MLEETYFGTGNVHSESFIIPYLPHDVLNEVL